MSAHIVEVIASNEVTCQFTGGIAKTGRILNTNLRRVKHALGPQPSGRASIRYSHVIIYVEPLSILTDGR